MVAVNNRKIAILHYYASPHAGGVERVIAHQSRLLEDHGWEVDIVAATGGPESGVVAIPEISPFHSETKKINAELEKGVRSERYERLRRYFVEVLGFLSEYQYVIAHNILSCTQNNAPLADALIDLKESAKISTLIGWHHDFYFNAEYGEHRRDCFLRMTKVAQHVTLSEVGRKEFLSISGLSQADVRVIPNGIDYIEIAGFKEETRTLLEACGLIESNPIILTAARLERNKNLEVALATASRLQELYSDFRWLITGPSSKFEDQKYVQVLKNIRSDLKLEGSVFFLGHEFGDLSTETVADLYSLADCMVITSSSEGFCLPVVEAASRGVPVVTTPVPAIEKFKSLVRVVDGTRANPVEFCAEIQHVLNQEVAQAKMSARCGFSWKGVYEQHLLPLLLSARL